MMNSSFEDSDYQGAPKTWKMLSDELLKTQLSLINPRYNLGKGYKSNCVNCVIAYVLRQRGYDVIARSSDECNVRRKATDAWYNVKEQVAESFSDVINKIDLNCTARYFLGIKYPNGDGHAVVLEVSDQRAFVIDAQIGKKYSISSLEKTSKNRFSFWRIDNLEITQTGYNACEGGSDYDV